jgi:hypothetical protein
VEAYVREWIRPNDAEADPVKVAVVHTDLEYSLDMATALKSLQSGVEVNGYPLGAPENELHYKALRVAVADEPTPDVSQVIQALRPEKSADIIISLGGAEFIDPILKELQYTVGPPAVPRVQQPFYLLSPRNAFDRTMTSGDYFNYNGREKVLNKSAGINYASVEDSTLYDEYLNAIQTRFQGQTGLEGRENMYDAAYFMLYALSAAALGGADFDGDDVVSGMKALVDGSEMATVGPGPNSDMISRVLTTLKTGGKVTLVGTLGPPDFNAATGARRSPGSVWCVDNTTQEVRFDVLRLDTEAPGGLKESGDGFCYPNFFPVVE